LLRLLWKISSGSSRSGRNTSGQEISRHSSSSRATRSVGGVPARTAALMAPMEMPENQSGSKPCSARAW